MPTPCFLVKDPRNNGSAHIGGGGGGGGGSGSFVPANRLVVRRNAAIGDSLCATVVADRLIDLGYEVVWQTHPSIHCVIRHHPRIAAVVEPTGTPDINLDGAYESDPLRRRKHFHQMFFERTQHQVSRFGINMGPAFNCRPRLRLTPAERKLGLSKFQEYPKPWVFICPRSDSYNVRQVPDGIWREAAEGIKGTKFWLGRHPGPPGIIDLKCQHMDNVIVWLGQADLLISVDTGPLHLGAALGVPVIGIGQSSSPELHLSDQADFVTIAPKLDCLNCQENVCRINSVVPPCQNVDPKLITDWANARLSGIEGNTVSALVSIYRPDVNTLNRCLECVLPQVNEVIVCSDLAGKVPPGALRNPKIRYVVKPLHDQGYGKKQNFAARQANGAFLLLLNDDVFLQPNAVPKMMECMTPDVGMVSNLLLYPDGTVYHAGKTRGVGQRGWGHLNHKQKHWDLKEPTRAENMCGACVIVRRKAFYEIGGFNERYFLYAEDDTMCLDLRKAGWNLMFTPHSRGIHLEHQSTSKTGNIMDYVNASNKIFHELYGAYLDHNINRVPMGNFDYM